MAQEKGPTLFDHYLKPDLLAPGNRYISALADNSVFVTTDGWRLNGGCPERRRFDLVNALPGSEALAEFLVQVPDIDSIQFRMHGESGLRRFDGLAGGGHLGLRGVLGHFLEDVPGLHLLGHGFGARDH